jgi:hypothetical protein
MGANTTQESMSVTGSFIRVTRNTIRENFERRIPRGPNKKPKLTKDSGDKLGLEMGNLMIPLDDQSSIEVVTTGMFALGEVRSLLITDVSVKDLVTSLDIQKIFVHQWESQATEVDWGLGKVLEVDEDGVFQGFWAREIGRFCTNSRWRHRGRLGTWHSSLRLRGWPRRQI